MTGWIQPGAKQNTAPTTPVTPTTSTPTPAKEVKPEVKEEVKEEVNNPFIPIKDNAAKKGLKIVTYGKSGTGKTRFGFTFPKPIYFIDTEMGATPLSEQMGTDGVNIVEIWEKGTDEIMERDEVACFEKIKQSINYLYENPPTNGTIIIDSTTDLWSMCQSYCKVKIFNIRPQDRLKYQFDWGKITNVYKQLITKLLTMPCNVLLCARSKEVYEGPNPTGQHEPALQKDTEYFSDLLIQMNRIDIKGGNKFVSSIKKCRQKGELMGQNIENLDYKKLKELIDA